MKLNKLLLALAASGIATSAFATNGMNMEGYGPIAAAMGGASMAYDNGTAAVVNNPATLGLMSNGSRFDVAVGMLGPDVTAKMNGMPDAQSGGDAYYMPAVGYVKKDGDKAYGVAMFAQGGMGTEYAGNSFMGAGTGLPTRSEVGVGRLVAPLSVSVNDKLTIGGSLDFVWAMMDIKMAALQAQVSGMTGMTTDALAGAYEAGGFLMSNTDVAYLNFSDNSDYTGKAKGSGWAGKLGFTYKASPSLTIGGTYHSKTSMSDLETSDNGASFSIYNGTTLEMAMPGKITVREFQWPETYGLGLAWQANDKTLLAMDVKHIGWKDVMQSFKMTFSNAQVTMPMTMPQNWTDQTVYSLGVAYKATDVLTVRVGANMSDNPVPDATMNPLFPAIEKDHYTAGFGYALDKDSDVNFSVQHAPKVTQTSGSGVTVDHSQTSWQLMYSKRF
jgi:long-chain fatty acid transport protein